MSEFGEQSTQNVVDPAPTSGFFGDPSDIIDVPLPIPDPLLSSTPNLQDIVVLPDPLSPFEDGHETEKPEKKRHMPQDEPNAKKARLRADGEKSTWRIKLDAWFGGALTDEATVGRFVEHMRGAQQLELEDMMHVLKVLEATGKPVLRAFVAGGGLVALKEWAGALPTAKALQSWLRTLSLMPVSVDALKKSAIGKVVNTLKKHSNKAVSEMASRLVDRWRDDVLGKSPPVPRKEPPRPASSSVFAQAIMGPKKPPARQVTSIAGAAPPPVHRLVVEDTPPPKVAVPVPPSPKERPLSADEIVKRKQLQRSQELAERGERAERSPERKSKKRVRWAEPAKLVQVRYIRRVKSSLGAGRAQEVEAQLEKAQMEEARRERAMQEALAAMRAAVPWAAPPSLLVPERLVPELASTEQAILAAVAERTLPAVYLRSADIPESPAEAPAEEASDEAPNILWGASPPPLGPPGPHAVVSSGDATETFKRLLSSLASTSLFARLSELAREPAAPPSKPPPPPGPRPSHLYQEYGYRDQPPPSHAPPSHPPSHPPAPIYDSGGPYSVPAAQYHGAHSTGWRGRGRGRR